MGGGFDKDQAFVGSLDQLYIMEKILKEDDISRIYNAGRTDLPTDISSGMYKS